MRVLAIILTPLVGFIAGCGESVQPEKVAPPKHKVFQKNATDAVGVAEGEKKVSPFGKPAH